MAQCLKLSMLRKICFKQNLHSDMVRTWADHLCLDVLVAMAAEVQNSRIETILRWQPIEGRLPTACGSESSFFRYQELLLVFKSQGSTTQTSSRSPRYGAYSSGRAEQDGQLLQLAPDVRSKSRQYWGPLGPLKTRHSSMEN